jgi:hypothetical protein
MTKLCRNSVAAFAPPFWVSLDSAALDTIQLLCRQFLCYLCVLFSVNEVTWYLWNLVRKLCHWRTLECLVSISHLWQYSDGANLCPVSGIGDSYCGLRYDLWLYIIGKYATSVKVVMVQSLKMLFVSLNASLNPVMPTVHRTLKNSWHTSMS